MIICGKPLILFFYNILFIDAAKYIRCLKGCPYPLRSTELSSRSQTNEDRLRSCPCMERSAQIHHYGDKPHLFSSAAKTAALNLTLELITEIHS